MPTNPKSDPNELDGRTKLLRSRPEPDNILVFGIATLIGLFFSFMAFYFVISEMIEIGWRGLDGFWPFMWNPILIRGTNLKGEMGTKHFV